MLSQQNSKESEIEINRDSPTTGHCAPFRLMLVLEAQRHCPAGSCWQTTHREDNIESALSKSKCNWIKEMNIFWFFFHFHNTHEIHLEYTHNKKKDDQRGSRIETAENWFSDTQSCSAGENMVSNVNEIWTTAFKCKSSGRNVIDIQPPKPFQKIIKWINVIIKISIYRKMIRSHLCWNVFVSESSRAEIKRIDFEICRLEVKMER